MRLERVVFVNSKVPDIIIREVYYTIKIVKNGKAPGPDNITVETREVMRGDCHRVLSPLMKFIILALFLSGQESSMHNIKVISEQLVQ